MRLIYCCFLVGWIHSESSGDGTFEAFARIRGRESAVQRDGGSTSHHKLSQQVEYGKRKYHKIKEISIYKNIK